jgi:hypothetical protein
LLSFFLKIFLPWGSILSHFSFIFSKIKITWCTSDSPPLKASENGGSETWLEFFFGNRVSEWHQSLIIRLLTILYDQVLTDIRYFVDARHPIDCAPFGCWVRRTEKVCRPSVRRTYKRSTRAFPRHSSLWAVISVSWQNGKILGKNKTKTWWQKNKLTLCFVVP